MPTYQGYLLLQRSGSAPALGEVLELPDTPGVRLVVAKLALSPLPQDKRVCAYLGDLTTTRFRKRKARLKTVNRMN